MEFKIKFILTLFSKDKDANVILSQILHKYQLVFICIQRSTRMQSKTQIYEDAFALGQPLT